MPKAPARRKPRGRRLPSGWERWSDEQILDLRLADLAATLRIDGTWLDGRIEQL